MQVWGMAATTARAGVTLRLDPDTHDRLRRIAAAEHRSVSAYLEMLVARDLAAREEAERVIRVYVAPEIADEPFGEINRENGESDERYLERSTVLKMLYGR